jgi:hypothetical protein
MASDVNLRASDMMGRVCERCHEGSMEEMSTDFCAYLRHIIYTSTAGSNTTTDNSRSTLL